MTYFPNPQTVLDEYVCGTRFGKQVNLLSRRRYLSEIRRSREPGTFHKDDTEERLVYEDDYDLVGNNGVLTITKKFKRFSIQLFTVYGDSGGKIKATVKVPFTI